MTSALHDVQLDRPLPAYKVAPGSPPMLVHSILGEAEQVGRWHGNRIFEDFSVKNYVAADGEKLIRVAVEGYNHLWEARAAAPSDDPLFANPWARTLPAGSGYLQLRGDGEDAGWFAVHGNDVLSLGIPGSMTPVISSDRQSVVYFEFSPVFRTEHPGHDLWIGKIGATRHLTLSGPVMGAAFTPDGEDAFVLTRQPDGASTLVRIETMSGAITKLAADLDTPPYWPGSIIFAASDEHVYLNAASKFAPDEALKRQPVAPRLTKIYRMPRQGGLLETVVTAGCDLSDIGFASGNLHWIKNICYKSVVALPSSGGALKEIIVGGYFPEWSPQGDRIGFTVGQFRLADWALCLDSNEVCVDAELNPIADPIAVTVGAHEEITHVYSPCGRWIAYHSHSGAATIPYYDAEGAIDAVVVRAAGDYDAAGVEMSEDGWEIWTPRWAPDGRTILYWSWDKKGHPGLNNIFLIDFDPETGRKLGHRKLDMPEGLINPSWAAYSPDGTEIVVEDSYGIGKKALWVISASGSSGRRLHDYAGDTNGGVCFFDGGKSIVFGGMDLELGTMQLFSISASGGAVTQLTRDRSNILHPNISPDGRWIAATRHLTTQEHWRAAVVG